MKLHDYIWGSRKDLRKDLEFFEYEETMTMCYSDKNMCETIYGPIGKKEVTSDQYEGALNLVINYFKNISGVALSVINMKDRFKIIIEMVNKAEDGSFSEIDIELKSMDDAIDVQGRVIGNFINVLNRIGKEWDNLSNVEAEGEAEININLSDTSPFKKLTKSQLRNVSTVEKTWNELPRFMYFEDELDTFEEEYNKIMEQLSQSGHKSLIRLIDKTIEELNKMDVSDLDSGEADVLNKLSKKINSKIKSVRAEVHTDLSNINNVKDFITGLNQIKSELEK